MIYDPTNTSLNAEEQQSLVELVLATAVQARVPGLVYDVKAVVRRVTHTK